MLIIDELRKLKQILLARSSLKEQVFYGFLVREPLNYSTENCLTEIEQICLSVFCADTSVKKDLTNLIKAHRKKQPISGLHYTKNLIELSAMAQDNVELERENLKSYCQNHSTRDFYILNHLFPDIYSSPPQPQGPIDTIALYLYTGKFPQEGWKPLLFDALLETSDLIDFYVIKQGYLRAMDDSPIVHQVQDIHYVTNAFAQFVEKTERRVKCTIVGVGALLLVPAFCWLVPLIIRNWNQAEPIIAAVEMSVLLIGVLIVGLIGFTPDKIKIFNLFKKKIVDWVFRIKGFDRSELKKRLDRLR